MAKFGFIMLFVAIILNGYLSIKYVVPNLLALKSVEGEDLILSQEVMNQSVWIIMSGMSCEQDHKTNVTSLN